jgi:hypothetical protein
VLAQCRPLVGRAEQAPTLEKWYHLIHEQVEFVGEVRRHDVEAVRPPFLEPALHMVDDLLGRADHVAVRARRRDLRRAVADRQLLPVCAVEKTYDPWG